MAAASAALALTGCGGNGSDSGLDEALTFIPKDAPLVVTIATDPDSDQWRQANRLAGRFPFSGQVKDGLKQRLQTESGIDFDRDIKPLLGNEAVAAFPSSVVALKVDDVHAAEAFAKKENAAGSHMVVKDGVLVAAPEGGLEAALRRHAGGDHMSETDLEARLGDLDRHDALTTLGIHARKTPALGDVGLALTAKPDGLHLNLDSTPARKPAPADLPLAPGAQAPPVVRRPTDVALGIRDLDRTIRFAETLARAADRKGFAAYRKRRARLETMLGLDLARDLTGDAALTIGIDGSIAFRSQLRNGGKTGFHPFTTPRGRRYVAGTVGNRLVIATTLARAAEFARAPATPVAGAKGALTIEADMRAIADEALRRRGQGTAALFTAALGDLTGSVESEADGLSGHLQLEIK